MQLWVDTQELSCLNYSVFPAKQYLQHVCVLPPFLAPYIVYDYYGALSSVAQLFMSVLHYNGSLL